MTMVKIAYGHTTLFKYCIKKNRIINSLDIDEPFEIQDKNRVKHSCFKGLQFINTKTS